MASQATLDRLCAEFDTRPDIVATAVAHLEQNATPAFLSRYRCYELDGLPEERLVAIAERLHTLTELEQRRATILEQAEERGRKTPELEATLQATVDQDLLDDYYQSMRPRRRGIAMQMEEKGLSPLALAIQHRQFGDAATETVPKPQPPEPKPEKKRRKPKQEKAATENADAEQASEGDAAATEATQADGTQAEGAAGEAAATETPVTDTPTTDAAAEAPAEEAAAQEATPDAAQSNDAGDSNSGDSITGDATSGDEQAPTEAPAEAASSAEQPAAAAAEADAPVVEPVVEPVDAPVVDAPVVDAKPVPDVDLAKLATPYVSAENELPTPESALEGALMILAHKIIHDPETRAKFREELRRGILRAKPVNPDGDGGKAKQFYNFAEPINRISSNRMLALRRAEREKLLRLELTLPEGRHRKLLRKMHAPDTIPGTQLGDFYDLVFDNAARSLQDLCGNDVRRRLKEKADREAMRTYGRNLRSQLLAPPLGAKKVMALRTSGKAIWVAFLNEDGSVGEHKTLPTDNVEQKEGAVTLLAEMLKNNEPHAIAIPHGRRQAGSEKLITKLRSALADTTLPMVVPVDEAASTIFATSTAGKKAIPGVEVGVRTAISLGRRLQDPLLELARMEVRTLGLGQTLDDVHQGTLQRELGRVKSSCLAEVGVDLNTSGAELLQMIPGLGHERAQALVKHRKSIGGFKTREQIKEVESINEACWRNIAAFVQVTGGDELLDSTPVHPDDYAIAKAVAEQRGGTVADLIGKNLRDTDVDKLVTEEWSKDRVIDVLMMLDRAGVDRRGELMATANEGIHTLTDLHQGRELKGRVASLTEFGAFIDMGIGQDGLVHMSQIPQSRLRDQDQMLRVGEVVTVWVLNVDQQKGKISLSMHRPRQGGGGGRSQDGEGRGQRRRRGGPREQGAGAGPGGGGRRPGPGGNRFSPGGGGRDGGGGGGGRGERRGRGGPRRGGPARIYTIEPEREVAEQLGKKGEATSLSSLRNLLGKGGGDQKKD